MINFLLMMFEFFKTGLFAVGGGLATIPFLSEMGEKFNWFSIDELSTMIAISESTPGPMGVNMATYVGFEINGLLGGILATLSLVTPSVIVVCIIANYYETFKNAKLVKWIFAGLKPSVVALIISATASLFISTLLNINEININFINYKTVTTLIILYLINIKYKKLHPIFFIVFSSIIGVIFKF